MAFWNREERLPEVMQPYGPYADVRGQLDTVYNEAQNRNAQRINQMYANVGMNPRGAPATAARARGSTDIENQRAQLGYQSYYDWLRGKQLAQPQILPSGASTIAAPFISGIGQAAGPAIVSGAVKGIGQGWDYLTGAGATAGAPLYGQGGYGEYTPNLSSQSGFKGAPTYGEGGYGEVPYANVAQGFDWSSLPATDAFSAVPTDFVEPEMGLGEALNIIWG